MTLKFYFDTHIPKAAAVQLRQRGIEVVRCEEVDLAEADDTEHLEYATGHLLTLVSHDRDFWELHGHWMMQGLHHTGIILFHHQFEGKVGKFVTELAALHQLIVGGAGSVEADIYNCVYEVNE
jgi:hypothetical protein